jgi:hypothetical protein
VDSFRPHRLNSRGYHEVLVRDRGWVLLHVSVMEEHLGRRLRKNESVHHINEIKTDNRICNLFACARLEHNKAHNMGRISNVRCYPHWIGKKCVNCGSMFYGPPKMVKVRQRCKSSCKPEKLTLLCKHCGVVYNVPTHASHVEYCSRRCRRQRKVTT